MRRGGEVRFSKKRARGRTPTTRQGKAFAHTGRAQREEGKNEIRKGKKFGEEKRFCPHAKKGCRLSQKRKAESISGSWGNFWPARGR